MFGKICAGLAAAVCLSACTQPKPNGFRLDVDLRNANPGMCYLYRLPLDADPIPVDSYQTAHLDERFVLEDPGAAPGQLYQLLLVAARSSLYFISDTLYLSAKINAVDPRAYKVSGSLASQGLQTLQRAQKNLSDSLYILGNKIQNGLGDAQALERQSEGLRRRLNETMLLFSDTAAHPLAALFIGQQVDFGTDTTVHKGFIARLARRFPADTAIQRYVQRMRDYFSLLDTEYEVGDTLPEASFTDTRGRRVVPGANPYMLLEFWASYCPQCLESLQAKKALYAKYRAKGFEIIAFSIDENPEMLYAEMERAAFPWPVVADFKGWSGRGPQTYKVDGIPSNFLIGARGEVLGKNVSAATLGDWLERR